MWGSIVKDVGSCRLVYMVALVWALIEKDRILDRVGSIHPRRFEIQSNDKSEIGYFITNTNSIEHVVLDIEDIITISIIAYLCLH